uniref:Transmembrane protein n=1 Tax=Trypanosoma vivax (strain Y486) TaxID=1055687 RepID=G0U014_TRYVY|nr:hypothetical protein, unlikely [Trypanosoma vivax Y486]
MRCICSGQPRLADVYEDFLSVLTPNGSLYTSRFYTFPNLRISSISFLPFFLAFPSPRFVALFFVCVSSFFSFSFPSFLFNIRLYSPCSLKLCSFLKSKTIEVKTSCWYYCLLSFTSLAVIDARARRGCSQREKKKKKKKKKRRK